MKKEQMFDELLNNWKVPAARSEKESWDALQARIAAMEESTPVRSIYQRPMAWVAAAAVVVLLAGAFLFSGGSENHVMAAAVENVVLPDGSEVALNAGSELTWSDDWSSERNVELKGEAFFEVEKGQKFTVSSPAGQVQVLGTSFNVCDENGVFRVDCYSGKVSVSHNGVERVITRGQSVKLRDGALCEPFEIAQTAPSWKNGAFEYTNADLRYVIDDIATRYGVEIVVDAAAEGAEFSGEFPDTDASTAIELVAKAMGMKAEPSGTGKYTLISLSDE